MGTVEIRRENAVKMNYCANETELSKHITVAEYNYFTPALHIQWHV